jgi:hypothetical protein
MSAAYLHFDRVHARALFRDVITELARLSDQDVQIRVPIPANYSPLEFFVAYGTEIRLHPSMQCVPAPAREQLIDALVGNGLQVLRVDSGLTDEAGHRIVGMQFGGALIGALAALRAVQGRVVGHAPDSSEVPA